MQQDVAWLLRVSEWNSIIACCMTANEVGATSAGVGKLPPSRNLNVCHKPNPCTAHITPCRDASDQSNTWLEYLPRFNACRTSRLYFDPNFCRWFWGSSKTWAIFCVGRTRCLNIHVSIYWPAPNLEIGWTPRITCSHPSERSFDWRWYHSMRCCFFKDRGLSRIYLWDSIASSGAYTPCAGRSCDFDSEAIESAIATYIYAARFQVADKRPIHMKQ
jgi:hypothetical protein